MSTALENMELHEIELYVRAKPETPNDAMTNFDHSIKDGAAQALREGYWGAHTAWDFYGLVWYEDSDHMFHELVKRYQICVDHLKEESLQDLMDAVNNKWGWE